MQVYSFYRTHRNKIDKRAETLRTIPVNGDYSFMRRMAARIVLFNDSKMFDRQSPDLLSDFSLIHFELLYQAPKRNLPTLQFIPNMLSERYLKSLKFSCNGRDLHVAQSETQPFTVVEFMTKQELSNLTDHQYSILGREYETDLFSLLVFSTAASDVATS